jgi:hypothetical protein
MKKPLILLTLFIAGCNMNEPPAEDVDTRTPVYTMEPGAIPSITGKIWSLEGIYNLETDELKVLDRIDDGRYSFAFDTDSTAGGEIVNSRMTVRLSRPFFSFSGKSEEIEEAKLFTRIASGISGCEYAGQDAQLKFYNEDNKTCLIYKFTAVTNMIGSIYYDELLDRWGIVYVDNKSGIILYDGGDAFFTEAPFPEEFKVPDARVIFSGGVTPVKYLETVDGNYVQSTTLYYFITFCSLNFLDI